MYCEFFDSPIGRITITADDKHIVRMTLDDCFEQPNPSPLTSTAHRQLKEYFEGNRKNFDLPLLMQGTDFQISVWNALKEIPYGQTRCYSDIAANISKPKASRAVGGAVHVNPFLIVIPCHRCIAKNGGIGGFAHGTDIKSALLKIEGIIIQQ